MTGQSFMPIMESMFQYKSYNPVLIHYFMCSPQKSSLNPPLKFKFWILFSPQSHC